MDTFHDTYATTSTLSTEPFALTDNGRYDYRRPRRAYGAYLLDSLLDALRTAPPSSASPAATQVKHPARTRSSASVGPLRKPTGTRHVATFLKMGSAASLPACPPALLPEPDPYVYAISSGYPDTGRDRRLPIPGVDPLLCSRGLVPSHEVEYLARCFCKKDEPAVVGVDEALGDRAVEEGGEGLPETGDVE